AELLTRERGGRTASVPDVRHAEIRARRLPRVIPLLRHAADEETLLLIANDSPLQRGRIPIRFGERTQLLLGRGVLRAAGEISALLRIFAEIVKLRAIAIDCDVLVQPLADHSHRLYRALAAVLGVNDGIPLFGAAAQDRGQARAVERQLFPDTADVGEGRHEIDERNGLLDATASGGATGHPHQKGNAAG